MVAADLRKPRGDVPVFEWLSGFLFNPAMAAGTAAVASPILIHILSRRRFRRIRWAAMDFLLEAQRRNRRRVKLEQLVLLALRCLAVLLVALMIARPFVRPGTAAALLGPAPRTERVFLLDDSYSMGYRLPGGLGAGAETVFSRATAAIAQIGRWIGAERPDDSLTLLRTSRPAEPSLALPSLSEENLRRLQDHLAILGPSQRPARMNEAIESAAGLFGPRLAQANTVVYIVSDFQRRDWIAPVESGRERPPSLLAALAAMPGHAEHLQVTLVDVGAESPGNVQVGALRALQPQAVAGVPARFEAWITNYATSPATEVELNVAIASQTLPPLIIPRVQPGQTVREAVEVIFPADGSDFLRISLAGPLASRDGLVLDNTRAAAVQVAPAIRVLIVDGQPNNDPYRDEVYLLKTALRPAGRASSGMELTTIEEDELEAAELGGYHAVILANAFRLGEAAVRQLSQFVDGGGGLIIFAGDQVDADVYNQALYRGGAGLLPAALGPTVDAPASAASVNLEQWDTSHPALRAFVDDLGAVLRQVRFSRYVTIAEGAASASQPSILVDAGAEPPNGAETRPASQPAARPLVLARLNDPDRSALIVQRRHGRGTVVFVATTADQDWNDWASNFSFVPIMLELVQHTARPEDSVTEAAAGAPIACTMNRARCEAAGRVRTPAHPAEPDVPVQAEPVDPDQLRFTYSDTERTGVYRFELTTRSGGPASIYATVNPDAAEGDLARATPAELEQALLEKPYQYVRDLTALTGDSSSARRELWWPLLLAAVLVLMTEHGLAWWFGARK